jgi:hypothetical protein
LYRSADPSWRRVLQELPVSLGILLLPRVQQALDTLGILNQRSGREYLPYVT